MGLAGLRIASSVAAHMGGSGHVIVFFCVVISCFSSSTSPSLYISI